MKCREFEAGFTELLKGDVEESKRRESLAHALVCSRCGALLESERRLSAELHALAAGHGREQAPLRVEQQLVIAFRAHSSLETSAAPSGCARRRTAGRIRAALVLTGRRWVWGAAAAGAVLGVVILAGLLRRGPVVPVATISRPQSTSPVNAGQESRTRESPQLTAVSQRQVPAVERARPRSPGRRSSDGSKAVEVEVATGFYTIPYVEPVRPEESIRVVRTSVPRYWLTAMGLPVNDQRAFDPVQADVLVGEDNVARAIRFVGRWQVPQSSVVPPRPVPVNAQYVP